MKGAAHKQYVLRVHVQCVNPALNINTQIETDNSYANQARLSNYELYSLLEHKIYY